MHILVPDHEITPGFTAYTVATEDGRVLTGLIASETPASITLRQALGKEDTIPRDQIAELSASKQSLMPQGLEKIDHAPGVRRPAGLPQGRGGRIAVNGRSALRAC